MTSALRFDPVRLPPECERLRQEVRAFLAEEVARGTFDPKEPMRDDADNPEFSRRDPDMRAAEGIGRLVAQLHTLRRMSVSVAGMLEAGKEPAVEAAIVKDLGTVWEQQLARAGGIRR
jgi:hypothetical protein